MGAPKLVPSSQTAIDGLDDPAEVRRQAEEAERDAERDADDQHLLFTQLIAACKRVARELTYGFCADELQRIWGQHGRHVTSAGLRACCEGVERNYFRIEWAMWFARQSEEVAQIVREMGGAPAPKKTPQQELDDLKNTLREEYPRQAQKLIRKAETR